MSNELCPKDCPRYEAKANYYDLCHKYRYVLMENANGKPIRRKECKPEEGKAEESFKATAVLSLN